MVTAKIWRCGGMKILRGCDCLWVEALNFLVPIIIFVDFALQNLTKLISGWQPFFQEKG
jgi:hypothetical protein